MVNQKGFSLIFVILGIVVIVSLVGGAYYLGTKQNLASFKQTSLPSSTTAPTPDSVKATLSPVADIEKLPNWKSFSNSYLSFQYPQDYTLNDSQPNSIDIFSPADQTKKEDKGSLVGETELKVTFIWEKSPEGDSIDKFLEDLTKSRLDDNPEFKKTATFINVSGVKAIHQVDSLKYGGETYFLISKGMRISIVKYPITTSRQDEFQKIISSFRLIN